MHLKTASCSFQLCKSGFRTTLSRSGQHWVDPNKLYCQKFALWFSGKWPGSNSGSKTQGSFIQINVNYMLNLLTLWWRKMKSSPIFAKILQLIPRGTLSSELFEFLRYLYPFQRYAKFSFSGFFNSARLFENLFSRKLQCLKYFLCWFQIRWNF